MDQAKPLKVLYVVSLFPCWSETFIVREIRALLTRGVDVRILSLRHPFEELVQSDAQELEGRALYPPGFARALLKVVLQVVRRPRASLVPLFQILSGLRTRPVSLAKTLVVWWRALAMADVVSETGAKLIHAHWATYPSTAAMILSRLLGIPFSFTTHAHDMFLEDHLLRQKLERCLFVVTISEFNRRFLADRYGERAVARLRVIHCGLPLHEFAYAPDGREEGTLLAVGRLDEVKGFEYLVEACGLLRDRGVDFRCEIVGEGELRERLVARLASLNLSSRVRLLGAQGQEQVRERLHRASVFVLPSVVAADGNMDGIPVALMEAMAVGLPVVTTRVSGIPELVRSGENGLLAAPADAAGLADLVASLLEDRGLRERLAAQARRTIEEEFDVVTEAGKLLESFADVGREAR